MSTRVRHSSQNLLNTTCNQALTSQPACKNPHSLHWNKQTKKQNKAKQTKIHRVSKKRWTWACYGIKVHYKNNMKLCCVHLILANIWHQAVPDRLVFGRKTSKKHQVLQAHAKTHIILYLSHSRKWGRRKNLFCPVSISRVMNREKKKKRKRIASSGTAGTSDAISWIMIWQDLTHSPLHWK